MEKLVNVVERYNLHVGDIMVYGETRWEVVEVNSGDVVIKDQADSIQCSVGIMWHDLWRLDESCRIKRILENYGC